MIHYSFPSIGQLRTVVKAINDRCAFKSITHKPTLVFHGTVKLHGTNASVAFIQEEGIAYAQSREMIITPESDNLGFARYVNAHNGLFTAGLKQALERYNIRGFMGDRDYEQRSAHAIAVYGEWCGKGVTRGVATSKLDKMFIVFAVKLIAKGTYRENYEEVFGDVATWLMPWDVQTVVHECFGTIRQLRCIEDYPTFNIDIDFNDPAASQNQLIAITQAIEARCPVGNAHGVEGVGEGAVWACIGTRDLTYISLDDLMFKVKGEKHSETKVKTLAPVDIEKVNSIKACAELVATPHRFEKGLASVKLMYPNDNVLEMKFIGDYLRWVGNDVLKEEIDTIKGNGLDPKDVTKAVNQLAKVWFIEQGKQSNV